MTAKTVYLAAVLNHPQFTDEVWQAIESRARQGQKIGLEINPEEMQEFERIRKLERIGQAPSFKTAIWPYLEDLIKRGWKRAGIKVSFDQIVSEFHTVYNDYEFFYEMYKRAKEKKLEVVPLETRYSLEKFEVMGARLQSARLTQEQREKITELRNYIRWPVKEKQMAKRTIDKGADFAVIGNVHREEVEKELKAQGIQTETIYEKEIAEDWMTSLKAKKARDEYWRRKRERQEIRGQHSRGEINREEMKKRLRKTDIVCNPPGLISRACNAIKNKIKKLKKPR